MSKQKRGRPEPESSGLAVSVSTNKVPKKKLQQEREFVKQLKKKILKMELGDFLTLTDTEIRFVLSRVHPMHTIQIMIEFIQRSEIKSV